MRRTPLALAATVPVLLALAACSSGTAADAPATLDPSADLSSQTLTVSTWADYYPADLAEKFQAATGVKVTIVHHATNEEIVAKLTASADPGIDVAFVSGQYAQALDGQGLLYHLDKSLIPNESNLYPQATTLAYDKGNVYSEPYSWGTTGLCYRPELTGKPLTSWGDLLNPGPELSGRTTMLATERWMLLPAQKLLGFSANTTDPAQLDQVATQLKATKPTLLAFDDTTFYSKLVSGEAAAVEAWDGWCNYAITDAPTSTFVIPKEGSDLWVDTMTVLKSSTNKEAAEAFINYILQPDIQSWVVGNILYKVPNKAAMEKVDPALLAQYPSLAITPEELAKQEVLIDLGDASTQYTRIATDVTSS